MLGIKAKFYDKYNYNVSKVSQKQHKTVLEDVV